MPSGKFLYKNFCFKSNFGFCYIGHRLTVPRKICQKFQLHTYIHTYIQRLNDIHSRPDTNRTGNDGLFFYYLRLLYCLDQMLAVMFLSQHRVSSSKTVRLRAPCGARCIGHAVRTWSAVCSKVPHSQSVKERDPICAWTNGIAQHQSAGG